MDAKVRTLMLELLAWVDAQPRTYGQAIDAWRSSCPRHPVWDDALLEGLVQVGTPTASAARDHAVVILTPRGRALLENG